MMASVAPLASSVSLRAMSAAVAPRSTIAASHVEAVDQLVLHDREQAVGLLAGHGRRELGVEVDGDVRGGDVLAGGQLRNARRRGDEAAIGCV